MVTDHSGVIVQKRFEKSRILLQLSFAVLLFRINIFTPHVCNNRHIFEGIATAKLLEHAERPDGYTPHPVVSDPLKVYDAMK
jgi:hypothetical protein